uniref:Uncharacterized protein n=1 Tax=Calidris pygmaea TaxID=425635 RepID=A0A8C3KEE4_9CHAR
MKQLAAGSEKFWGGAKRNRRPSPSQNGEIDPWESCCNVVFWKCKLWMVIITIFLVVFLVILISLILYSSKYLTLGLSSNKNVQYVQSNITQIEQKKKSGHDLKTFILAFFFYLFFSNESSTVLYQLEFSIPPLIEGFMENTMNPDFIRNVLRQNIYDEDDAFDPEISECDRLKLDPTSLTLTCKCCPLKGTVSLQRSEAFT